MGDTLQDPEYERYMIELMNRGVEIALHGVRGGSSVRAETLAGIDTSSPYFGATSPRRGSNT